MGVCHRRSVQNRPVIPMRLFKGTVQIMFDAARNEMMSGLDADQIVDSYWKIQQLEQHEQDVVLRWLRIV